MDREENDSLQWLRKRERRGGGGLERWRETDREMKRDRQMGSLERETEGIK